MKRKSKKLKEAPKFKSSYIVMAAVSNTDIVATRNRDFPIMTCENFDAAVSEVRNFQVAINKWKMAVGKKLKQGESVRTSIPFKFLKDLGQEVRVCVYKPLENKVPLWGIGSRLDFYIAKAFQREQENL